ncbi:hypothetical protein SADUNF_Sadunf11G0117900 [Salix dunnii]|uniref:Uncharacterized protein n=1 Tax=Salix dunnii TaxID=1413687 RepID=A0A835JR97_9ROSI|nr:hypothetical protein SADUNF_Sadunf11G0117900 [Salix dunnii]
MIARPLTFVPFACALAYLASTCMKKHQMPGSKSLGLPPTMKREVQTDFAFVDPKSDDFHGVKILLQSYLDNKEWGLSDFTTVGMVVKIEDDEDNRLFSVVPVLDLGRYKATNGGAPESFRFKPYLLVSKIYKLCSWSFNFPFHAEKITAHELKIYRPMGLVLVVEADKISTFREQLHSLIDVLNFY